MLNIKVLFICDAVNSNLDLLLDPDGSDSHMKLLPSHQELHLEYSTQEYPKDWDGLIQFLIHRSCGGHCLSKIVVSGFTVHIFSEVQKQIRGFVEQFDYVDRYGKCPLNLCSG